MAQAAAPEQPPLPQCPNLTFLREKNAIIELEQDKILSQYEEKLKEREMEFKIKRSTSINRSRLEKMEARNRYFNIPLIFRAMMKIFSDAQYQLYKKIRSEPQFYKDLLVKLIAQGLIKIYEKKVKIRCLKKDVKIVQECVPLAKKMFEDLIRLELDKEITVDIEVDQDKCLEEREVKDNSRQAVEQYDLEMGRQEVILKNEDD